MFKNWKQWAVLKPLIDLYNSLFNNDKGFSYRKIAAGFSVFFVAYKISMQVTDDKLRVQLVEIWLTFGCICLGLITIPDLIKFLVTIFANKPVDTSSDRVIP
jgi:hypothetical protein